PVVVTPSMLDQARATIPELPAAKRRRYVEELGLTDYDARWLTVDPDTAGYFDAAAAASGQPKAAANWVMGDVAAAVSREEAGWTEIAVPAAQLGKLIERIEDGSISGKIAKSLFKTLWDDGGEVDALIESQGLKQVSDSDEIGAIVRQVIDANPAQVEQVRAGKTRVLGFLVGQAMKASGGKANPRRVSELLQEALSADGS
ncbi:MAG: Asp-tRNA(Asn)/Glu-tRNA(Gln) amidotransferase GatCAB subunit B, partial [Gammaproteobacteria bacterium]|nr:Asp-tRNA(Asn)/Glu-tRNA(Gln) amidotransferase GatCAB subunit B [Gammaproteobacteria bacterium]